MVTENWTDKQYQNHIIKNNLDQIWTGWCNPSSVDGVRTGAFTPLYNEENIKNVEKSCTKPSCKNGMYKIPDEDHKKRIIFKVKCDVCNSRETKLFRWISKYDRTKVYFNNPETVKNYGLLGRSFYGSLTLYNKDIIPPKGRYVDESLMVAHTLGMDIDIVSGKGTICDTSNKEDLDKCLNIIREDLDTFVPNSYNLQSSGNGIYIYLHHLLCKYDIYNTMSMYNSYIKYLNKLCEDSGLNRIKIDPINIPSRVYKLIGSIHQKYDLVAIPLQHDCKITSINNNQFKLNNFSIQDYIIDEKLQFYNRVDKNETVSLYKRLEEHSIELESSGLRAVKHNYSNILSDAISGESTTINNSPNITDEQFMKYYVGWKKFKIDIPGRVIYKNNTDGTKTIEMIGVPEKDHERIIDMIYDQAGV